ncbi:MAG: F0F1 ATP synthase subunit B [Acholeplasmataceae bacterium]|nr:F0F1 ATP synthase subunit B [Acholeplasmataceae bacterium]
MNQVFEDAIQGIQTGLNSVIEQPHIVVLNLLAFLVLLFFVRKFLWKSVTGFIEKRQAALAEALELADQEVFKAKELQENSVKEYEQMKHETRELKERLTLQAYREQEELIEKAKLEAKRRIEQAEKDIEYEIQEANDEIRQSIKEVAFAAAKKIVKREIDETVHDDIVEEIIQERFKS